MHGFSKFKNPQKANFLVFSIFYRSLLIERPTYNTYSIPDYKDKSNEANSNILTQIKLK